MKFILDESDAKFILNEDEAGAPMENGAVTTNSAAQNNTTQNTPVTQSAPSATGINWNQERQKAKTPTELKNF